MSTEFDNEWEALQKQLQGNSPTYTEADLKTESAMPLQKLMKQWNMRIVFTLILSPMWLVAMLYFNEIIIKLLMGLVLGSNLWSLYISLRLKDRIKDANNSSMPVLDYLKTTHKLISTAIKLEEQVFIFIYPISVAAGFFAGLSLSGAVNDIMGHADKVQNVFMVLFGSMVVLTPLSHLFARWLNKLAFGNYLKELERLISAYEPEKN